MYVSMYTQRIKTLSPCTLISTVHYLMKCNVLGVQVHHSYHWQTRLYKQYYTPIVLNSVFVLAEIKVL